MSVSLCGARHSARTKVNRTEVSRFGLVWLYKQKHVFFLVNVKIAKTCLTNMKLNKLKINQK